MDDPRITRYASEKYVKEFVNEAVTNAGTGSVNLDDYVKKVDGMGLTHNDLTDTLKTKYDGAATHASSTHAPTNAQKNSDITKAEIEAKLTGDISTHTHSSYALANSVPTKVSQLENDSKFLTSHQSLAGLATETFVNTAVAGIVDSAPAALDTLKELSTALGDDPNFATTVATNIGGKVDKVDGMGLTHNDLTDALKSGYDSAATHANTAHAPSNAQKNSDITKAEIEAKLTGDISTHTHSRYATQADLDAVSKINVESYDEIFDASVNESPLIEASDVSFAGGTAYQLNVDMEFDETEFPYTISVGSDSSTVQHNFSEDDFVYDEEHSCWKASVDEVNEIFVGKNESGKVLITYDTILPTFYYIHIQKVTKQGTMSIRNYVDYKSEEASDNDIIAMLTEVLGGDYSA